MSTHAAGESRAHETQVQQEPQELKTASALTLAFLAFFLTWSAVG